MTARASMATLITDLRFKVGDPIVAGTPPTSVFTDDELQSALDRHRTDVLQAPLTARPTRTATGYEWLIYQAPLAFWEDGYAIQTAGWDAVTSATADTVNGRWTFTASTLPTLYITGTVYDLHGAAVEVLRAWQARVASEYDFGSDGQSFSRSQKSTQLAALAREYQRQARG